MSKENIEITTIKITDLNPAQYNPRKISNEEYNKLSRSINEFGLVDPIIINLNNNHIIGGHQRYDVIFSEYASHNEDYGELILIKNGDIGWVFVNEDIKIKDLNQEKSMNISLNKIQGEWDFNKLEDLFNDLSVEGVDLSITGWDKNEIKELSKDIELKHFGDGGLSLEDALADEELVDSDSRSSRGKPIKHYECPSCGYEWSDEQLED